MLHDKFRAALIDFSIRGDIERCTDDLRRRIWQVAFAEAGERNAERG
jgi:hypothetical protein